MLKKLLPGLPGKNGVVPKGIFYYPRGGFGQISQSFCEAAREAGADIRTGTQVRRVMPEAGGYRVEFDDGGELQTLNTQHVWSTIPITALTRLIEPAAPENVNSAARSLRFRGMLLIYLVLDTQQFTPFDAHYLPAADIRITRLSEPKNYAARIEPRDTTVLCAELPCQPGDDVWGLDETALGRLVLEDLAQAGIPVKCEVRQVVVKRLPQAYPLYPVGFEKAFNILDTWVEGLSNILTFGRQGLYAHDNTHHALYMAAAAVRCLADGGAFDHDEWAREREIFATHVVED